MVGAWKLNEDDVKIIKDLLEIGKTHTDIAKMFNVSREHITKIANGQRWNKENHSFTMKDELEKPKTSNDYREFSPSLPVKKVEIEDKNEALDMEQKYYLVKFIESLTGRKIKKLIVQF